MRPHAKLAQLLLFVCTAALSLLAAQEKQESHGSHSSTRPSAPQHVVANGALSSTDGLAILGAALDSRHRQQRHPDCSHFVHELYEQAGFPYEYASSSDLYAGIEGFQRVTNPQPGDLAVWHGHVGIVVNPRQHSFFSLLRTGPGVDLYDSPYWRRRGTPHFFRYVKAAPASVPRSSVQNANWKRPVPENEDDFAGDEPVPDESDNLPVETESFDLAQVQSENPVPRAIIVNAAKPKPDQVSTAFLQTCKDWEQKLRGRDLFKSSQSLVVFDHFEVRKVHIAGNQGWAEIQIQERVFLKASNADTHKRTEHQRWTLTRREKKTWELSPAPNTIYLPQGLAVRLLATELAQLTAAPEAASQTEQKAQLARLLDVLLEK